MQIILVGALLFIAAKFILGKQKIMMLKNLPIDQYTLIDVRTKSETITGMLDHAINIPLDEISSKLGLIPQSKPVYLYCASGARSGMAVGILKQKGYKAYNLGAYSVLRG